ncbi:MAG: hypothetical protein QE271_10230 [Bacteriovoracaceae bacterium]|nr:hypothetical protein [Bacteriovoracaceae bacterium]
MIYGRLLEKVSIKKIPLRVWGLSNEISHTLKNYKDLLLEKQENPELAIPYTSENIQAFYENEYQKKEGEEKAGEKPAEKPKLTLVKNEAESKPEASPETSSHLANNETKPDSENPSASPQAAAAEVKTASETMLDKIKFPIELRQMIHRYVEPSDIYQGYAILYDINFDEISFFSEFAFLPGQEIIIELGIAKSFTIHAEVDYIKSFQGKTRLIQAWKPICRIKAKFLCRHPGDRTLLREFLRSVDTKLRNE